MGGKPKAGYNFHLDTDSGAVSSERERNGHNPQDRQRWLSAIVWHHPQPY